MAEHTIAEIIAVGSEMLTPHRQDTNSLYLTQGLNDLGVQVGFKSIVGDQLAHLTAAIRTALDRADLILISGGLGPTEDDLTREAAAAALGVALHPEPSIIAALYKRFAERRIPMTPNNAKQADLLDGATLLPNAQGSAPGQFLRTTYAQQERMLILLPGPPKELKPLFDAEVKPRLAAMLPAHFMAHRTLRMALVPESTADARTAPIYRQYSDVETTILAHHGEILLNFQCSATTLAQAQSRVDELADKIEHEMADDLFSAHGESLEEVVLLMLGMRQLTVSTAESMTGGLLAQRLTAVPNSSRVFTGGAVVYSPAAKTLFAHVPPGLLEEHGTVSEATARALAEGIRAATRSSIGIAITGLAGPNGGAGVDADKPVGLVYVAVADALGTRHRELHLPGDRERVRWWATQHALDMLRRHLLH